MSEEENKAITRRSWEAVSQGNLDVPAEVHDADDGVSTSLTKTFMVPRA